jgi:hypothetical protein
MDIRDEQFKQFIINLTALLRAQELSLLAHQAVLSAMDPDMERLSPQIAAAKQNPVIQRSIQEKYDTPLAKFQNTAERVGIWKAVTAMLQEMREAPTASNIQAPVTGS